MSKKNEKKTTVNRWELAKAEDSGEYRIGAFQLGERLGYSRTRKFKELVDRHKEELLRYGPVPMRPTVGRNAESLRNSSAGPGRPGKEPMLNEAQALLMCMFAGAKKAADIRQEIIEVYQLVRHGQLTVEKKKKSPSAILREAEAAFRAAFRLAKLAGVSKDDQLLAANTATEKLTRCNVLELLGVAPELPPKEEEEEQEPSQEPEQSKPRSYPATDIRDRKFDRLIPSQIASSLRAKGASKFGTAVKVNDLLKELGYQEQVGSGRSQKWVPTEEGREYACYDMFETEHRSGQQLKWYSNVVPRLLGHIQAKKVVNNG